MNTSKQHVVSTQENYHVVDDYKLVTFFLNKQLYGINIMAVKEIVRFRNFTLVPNTIEYVRGIYNLRGDIIPLIDLRQLFYLPFQDKHEEQGLIIRYEDTFIGLIVDEISMVINIVQTIIQKPHPIFSDINIEYIEGIVDFRDHIYIILDIIKILSTPFQETHSAGYFKHNVDNKISMHKKQEYDINQKNIASEHKEINVSEDITEHTPQRIDVEAIKPIVELHDSVHTTSVDLDTQSTREHIIPIDNDTKVQNNHDVLLEDEQLHEQQHSNGGMEDFVSLFNTLSDFYIQEINQHWFDEYYTTHPHMTLQTQADVAMIVHAFYSPYTEKLWGIDLLEAFTNIMVYVHNLGTDSVYNILNLGCSEGLESWSIAACLKKEYPDNYYKIWASDHDFMKISEANMHTFDKADIISYYHDLLTPATQENRYSFITSVRDMIVFEFHDILHKVTFPVVECIIMRDVLSHIPQKDVADIMTLLYSMLCTNGILIIGVNEDISLFNYWKLLERNSIIKVYQKN